MLNKFIGPGGEGYGYTTQVIQQHIRYILQSWAVICRIDQKHVSIGKFVAQNKQVKEPSRKNCAEVLKLIFKWKTMGCAVNLAKRIVAVQANLTTEQAGVATAA